MPMEPIRTYRRQGNCRSCHKRGDHVYFEEKFLAGGIRLQIKRVCQGCGAKVYWTDRTDGTVENAGWHDD
jgi:hypothetical protein